MNVVLGFDPGGEGNFGWAVCIDQDNGLQVLDAGAADHARGALEKSLKALPKEGMIVGAGIDAPMFWVFDGSREADRRIRAVISSLGAPAPGGTVQHFNSLRGACVIQDLLVFNIASSIISSSSGHGGSIQGIALAYGHGEGRL